MLGTLNHQVRKATVVGGGIAGMLAAYFLDRSGFEVTLHEATSRLGGLIQTEKTPWGISECAAHSILVTPEVRQFCEEIGVELVPVQKRSKARYILRGGKFRKFPLTFWESIKAFLRAYFMLSPWRRDPGALTMQEWSDRFLGRAFTRFAVTPMLRGIYGASPGEITVGTAFPALMVPRGHSLLSFQLAKIIRGKIKFGKKSSRPEMMAPKGGMENLIKALESRLRSRLGDRLLLNSPVSSLPQADNLVLAMPAWRAGELLSATDWRLAHFLKEIKYTSLLSVTAFVDRTGFLVKSKIMPLGIPQGVGVLMAEGEKLNTLGMLFNSSSFCGRVTSEPNSPWVSVTAFLGGTGRPEELRFDDSTLTGMIEKDLNELFGFRGKISGLRIHRWERAIPQYNLKLAESWTNALQGWCAQPGRILFGNYTGQVSVRGLIESSMRTFGS